MTQEGVVVRKVNRADRSVTDALGEFGVATIHEAQGRSGLMAPRVRPIFPGAHVCGTAITVSVPSGDNWMVHVAVEQCQNGDLLVVAPTSDSDAGYVGELLATSMVVRGVRAVVIDAGCRDVDELTRMGFPVWSRIISAQGTVKERLGTVNLPIECGGQLVHPGDVVVADDDGVVVVPRNEAATVLEASRTREETETVTRRRYQSGELSLDVYEMRERLSEKGIRYVDEEPKRGAG